MCVKNKKVIYNQLLIETHMDLELGYYHFTGEKTEIRREMVLPSSTVVGGRDRIRTQGSFLQDPTVHFHQACRTQN